MTALYERLFPRWYKTESCWKVYIRCVTAHLQPQYRDLLGMYELDINADAEGFFALGDADKKWWAFEQLQRGIEQLRRQTGWDEEPFAATAAQAIANRSIYNSIIGPGDIAVKREIFGVKVGLSLIHI